MGIDVFRSTQNRHVAALRCFVSAFPPPVKSEFYENLKFQELGLYSESKTGI